MNAAKLPERFTAFMLHSPPGRFIVSGFIPAMASLAVPVKMSEMIEPRGGVEDGVGVPGGAPVEGGKSNALAPAPPI
jgi:hypothetical protein